MKKLLGIVVLGLMLSGNAYALSKCTVKKPNTDKLFDWKFIEKYIYPDTRLGESLQFRLQHRNRTLSYYSYNFGHTSITQELLDKQLLSAVGDIKHKFSQDKNVTLKDKTYILPIDKFHNFANMKNFITKGIFMELLSKTSSGSKRYLEIVAVGTDNYCFHKIRYSTQLSMASDAFPYALRIFELDLEMFYEAMKN